MIDPRQYPNLFMPPQLPLAAPSEPSPSPQQPQGGLMNAFTTAATGLANSPYLQDVGVGMLASSGATRLPVTNGEAMAKAMGYADNREIGRNNASFERSQAEIENRMALSKALREQYNKNRDYEQRERSNNNTNAMRNAEAMGFAPGSPEYNNYISNSGGGVTVNTGNAPSGYRFTPEGNLSAIEGGPADPSTKPIAAESAGKLAMSQAALSDLEYIEGTLFDEAGDLQESNLSFVPFSDGLGSVTRQTAQAARRAIEAALRMATGAAAPESEVDNYMSLYFPSALDSDEGARRKIQQLRAFIEGTINNIRPGAVEATNSPSGGQSLPPQGLGGMDLVNWYRNNT